MKILLTGGSGFLGRHIRESLDPAFTLVAPSHKEFDVTDANRVDEVMRDGGFDAVIHAAVQGGPAVLETTLRGYWNLARNASRVGRILYFGSGAEYGKHRDIAKLPESAIGEETPRDPYGLAKILCNELCRQSRNITNLRIFGLYGPYEGYTAKFISNAVAKTIAGVPLIIRQNVIFDYLWIDDLIRMLPRFLSGERLFADVNATPTQSVSLTEIATAVLNEAQLPVEFEVETPGLNYQYTGDNRRLLQYCPGFAFTSIEEGVRKLFAYYRAHPELIDHDALADDAYRRRCGARAATTEGVTTT
ncbi:MAG TPA: NAD(P)-dependent oxidoreductase [Thermoanaerobaculia bacterium]